MKRCRFIGRVIEMRRDANHSLTKRDNDVFFCKGVEQFSGIGAFERDNTSALRTIARRYDIETGVVDSRNKIIGHKMETRLNVFDADVKQRRGRLAQRNDAGEILSAVFVTPGGFVEVDPVRKKIAKKISVARPPRIGLVNPL